MKPQSVLPALILNPSIPSPLSGRLSLTTARPGLHCLAPISSCCTCCCCTPPCDSSATNLTPAALCLSLSSPTLIPSTFLLSNSATRFLKYTSAATVWLYANGVQSQSFFASGFAPALSNNLNALKFPAAEAWCNGVFPSASRVCARPGSRARRTGIRAVLSPFELCAQRASASKPLLSTIGTLRGKASTSARAAGTWPSRAASMRGVSWRALREISAFSWPAATSRAMMGTLPV